MKLLRKAFVKDGAGEVKLVAEEAEDMWHAFNLIREGDHVNASTFRKVTRETGSGQESERVRVKITLAVEGVEFDPEGASLRLKGRNLTESEHIKLGAYHTLELEPGRPFTVAKAAFDSLDIERISTACDPAASADLAVLLITEGLANLLLVGGATTLGAAKVEAALPRKRGAAAAGYDKAYEKFQAAVFGAVVRHVDWSVVKCLVIAGPGFAKDTFKSYLDEEAVRREARALMEHRSAVITAPASSAYRHALGEVLAAPGVAERIKDTKAAKEAAGLQAFYTMLASDPARAFYGPGHVMAAAELGAVQTLLISDKLFRVNDVTKRCKWAALIDGVRAAGGEALLFSSAHVSGAALDRLSGVAALLRFPLPELEDQELVGEV